MNNPSSTPLVLLVNDQEWTSRSFESILRPRGYVVVKAYTGQQALDMVRKTSPDLVILDFHLPDFDGIDLARRLREAQSIQDYTPFVMVSSSTIGRASRLEALDAGIWEILRHPVDPREILMRLENFIMAKQAADRVREETLTDPTTGFYNVRGLLRKAREMSADAARFERPIACVALGREFISEAIIGAEDMDDEQLETEIAALLSQAIQRSTRGCDSVGRLDRGDYVILAPGTDEQGARRLADRILTALDQIGAKVEEHGRILAGCFATRGDKAQPVDAEDLLFNATLALRRAQGQRHGFRIRAYDA